MNADLQALAAEAVASAEGQPRDVAAQLHAASRLFEAGERERSLEFARAAVAADPASRAAMRTLSGILDAVGERAEAIRTGLEAVRLDPAEPEARLHLGAMLLAERRWKDAAEHLSVHVVSNAATPVGWRMLSAALNQAGQPERATDAARRAVEADPNTIDYRLHLASLLSAGGRYTAARDELMTALAQDPGNALTWRMLSGVDAALGDLGDALKAAERAVALVPQDADCRGNLAYIAGLCEVPVARDDPADWAVPVRRAGAAQAPRRPSGLAEDIATRWRVIHAIMLRDIRTRFGHTQLGYFWAIMEPISHLMTLGMVFYAMNHAPPPVGDNLFLFYITGLVPYLMFSHVSHDVMSSGEANNAMLQLPMVKRTDIMVAHALRQLATEVLVGIIIFSIAALLGEQGLPADVLTSLCGIVLIWLLAAGVGAFNLVIVEMFPSYDTVYAASLRLLYVASGIYYSPIMMPDWVRELLAWNPILQGIELFRSGFYPQYEPHWLDVNYLLVWVVASVGIGFALERSMRSKMVVYS